MFRRSTVSFLSAILACGVFSSPGGKNGLPVGEPIRRPPFVFCHSEVPWMYNRFVTADGWVMTVFETGPTGRPSKFRFGRFFVNMLLNFLHLAIWFVCLWLLLRFQWAHALGLALAIWLVMTLFVVPQLLTQAVVGAS